MQVKALRGRVKGSSKSKMLARGWNTTKLANDNISTTIVCLYWKPHAKVVIHNITRRTYPRLFADFRHKG